MLAGSRRQRCVCRHEVQQGRKAAKKRSKEAAAKIVSEMQSHTNQKTAHTAAEDPTMTWEKSGLYRTRLRSGGARTVAQQSKAAATANDIQINASRQAGEVREGTACAGGPGSAVPEYTTAVESVGAPGPIPSEQQSADGGKKAAACSAHLEAACGEDLHRFYAVHARMHVDSAELLEDGSHVRTESRGAHSKMSVVHVTISCTDGSCHVQLWPACNPLKRKAVAVEQAHNQQSSPDGPAVTYTSYEDFYRRKYGLTHLSKRLPLVNVRKLPMHMSAPNYLVAPAQGSRHREMLIAAQHDAIEKTLHDANEQPHIDPSHTAGDPNAPQESSPQGPMLVAELCSIHPLRVSTLQALQFIPSLMYRIEVPHQTLCLVTL